MFEKLLEKRLQQPRVGRPLRGTRDRYKIKLRDVGYRLVYEVQDSLLVVLVLTVGRRDSEVYDRALKR
jgi:mRNA interferase RelE/StbE